ncbi:hypothetical protein CDAR_469571 [Caerostris darwini]|uniref:Granulin n=1 Tax=Caerostris darwini TaxID=1538125 RepID=A0AAV4R0G1_9ARAC|nr:hypothetical protein CDAR_469572 [Caerostris darwini]GIY13836.1 hypothetical protein CDAR_469571 [Caerostris darwini]
MKNFLLFIALPCFATASILCPDSQTSCPNGQACCLRSDGRHSCCDAVGTEARLSENSPLAYLNSSNLLHGSSMDTGCSTETCTGTCCPERSTNQWCCQLQYAKCCDHGTCCNLGQKCCPDTCCPWMSLCCGENCCEVMGKCCSRYTGVCCSQDEQCCAESCCRKGYKCCGDWCCRGTLRCGTEPNTCINMGFALVPCQTCCLSKEGRHSCCDAVGTEARLPENSPQAYLNSSNLLRGSSMDTGCSKETCSIGTCCPESSSNQWCCQLLLGQCCEDHRTCCDFGQKCCPDTCCPLMSLCCGEKCCEILGTCCSRYTGVCCRQEEECCGDSCCWKGFKCCGDWCCDEEKRCGIEPNTCFDVGVALVPCLATLALLLSVSSVFNSRLL